MNKSIILTLAVAAGAVLVGGCHSGPSNKKLIGTTMADWRAAVVAKDLDKVMVAYSEGYTSERGDGKARVREFMKTVFERGWMDNAKIDLEQAETVVNGDQATFGPVKFTSERGNFAIGYVLKKEDRIWRIVGSKREE